LSALFDKHNDDDDDLQFPKNVYSIPLHPISCSQNDNTVNLAHEITSLCFFQLRQNLEMF